MIHEEKTYTVTCDTCGRSPEVLRGVDPIRWHTRRAAMHDWTSLGCGPEVAPDGKALCWECAELEGRASKG